MPGQRGFVGLDPADRSLVPVRCDTWGGMVFVSLDPDGPALADWLDHIGLIHHDLAAAPALRRVEVQTYEQDCNWKVLVDAFIEDYHVTTVHPDTLAGVLDNRRSVIDIDPNGHSGMFIPYREDSDGSRVWAADLPPMDVHPLYSTDLQSFSVFPNLMIGSDEGTGFFAMQWWPLSKTRTRMDVTWYGVDWGEGAHPDARAPKLFGSEVLMHEDLMNVEPIQDSLEAAGHRGIPLGYQERRLWHFHAELDKVIGVERIDPALRTPDLLGDFVLRAPGG